MNLHCDFVPIQKAYDLMENLGIKSKTEFAKLCGVNPTQFWKWEQKGRMPEYRLSLLRQTVALAAKKKYDETLSILYAESE